MKATSPDLATLSPEEKRALLAQLLQEEAGRSHSFPLSFAQQRMWFLAQLEPGNPAYNLSSAYRLGGPLDVAALERSLNEIVRRHEALRTTFSSVDGEPVQVITSSLVVPLSLVDLRGLAESEREAEALQLARAEAGYHFDLATGPLLRATLFRLDEADHLLVLVLHHIIGDGWSMGVLRRELSTLYQALSAGRPSSLPERPVQYADFAIWQREWLRGETLEQQLAYWREQLAYAPALELPTDYPRPAVQTYRGARQTLVLPDPLVQALRALSQRESATLFMTLLAAFNVLLHRYTGQTDIVVGSPTAGRNRAEIEGLIGFFVNTLALRTDLAGNPTFRELLARVREACLGAYAHQDLPFEKLVEELGVARELSRTPLFQVMLVLQNVPSMPLELSGLTVTRLYLDQGTAMFDLALSIRETEHGLRGTLEYNTDLFEPATIARMLGHYRVLLEAIVADPQQRITALPILTDAERHQMLVEWNDTDASYPGDLCIHQLVEAQADRTPEAVAVRFGDRTLTYRALNTRANQLAHHLQRWGVGPEVMVGIWVERSVEMIVGLLGVLKAGGAYLPLDPKTPSERLAFMLADAQAPVLLTQRRFIEKLPQYAGHVLCLDSDWQTVAQEPEANPVSQVTAGNLAYVIYTSGSTGRPKGVLIEHRGVVNLVAWHQRTLAISAADRASQVAALTFDASVWELWPFLAAGASVHIADEETRTWPTRLRDWLVAEGITISWLPTVLTEAVLPLDWPASVALRTLLTGGDRLRSYPPPGLPFELVNAYGPTENTVDTTAGRVPPEGRAGVAPPIGRPISNVQVYLLDRHLQPVPIGVPGELCIGGDGLARGYLNRPELTAEAFVPNPFSDIPGARLYRTGDLARYAPDGNIEFLGRLDYQVKIRGFRIELGEVTLALRQHPAAREAMVLAREDKSGGKYLVAYVIPQQKPAPTSGELRRFLKDRLPDYMIPAVFVFLDAWPLTSGGKVDRRALPVPDLVRPEAEGAFVAPRTPVEEVLADIWAEVLGREPVGIHDNFFELGGHSLLATRVMSRIHNVFHVELPLRILFETPTVAGLARVVAARRAEPGAVEPAAPTVPALRAAPRPPARGLSDGLPLSYAQERLWFLDQLEPDNPVYNVPAAHRLAGPLDILALEQALNAVAERHAALRTTFPAVNGQPVQIVAPAAHVHVPVIDLRDLPPAERAVEAERLAVAEAQRCFDLAAGPLWRCTVLRLVDQEHVLLLTLHHIIADGWALDVLFRELAAFYRGFTLDQPVELPPLPIQYPDFAAWQREWLQGQVLSRQLAYWKQRLADAPPVLTLPGHQPRPALQTFRGAKLSFALPADLRAALRALSRREGVTLFMTLLAGFQVLLQRYAGQDDIPIGVPVANRTRPEIERLIGFFANTLVLRTDLSGNPTFRELLARVREVALGAYEHQDLPFERLVEELQPARSTSHNPLFQVMFVVQNTPGDPLQLPGLTACPLAVDTRTAKFDLTVSLSEDGQSLSARVEYSTDLFDAPAIERLWGHYQTLLRGAVEDPDRPIGQLPLLTEAERHQLLVEWNDTQVSYPQDSPVHERVQEQVERTPEALAVACGDQRLTYRELNTRANQLAHHLQKWGVRPEVMVGICVERSVEMVVGLLAILKAGGAYLPLDPKDPPERLAVVLTDAQAPVLLTQQRFIEKLPEYAGHVVCLDSDWQTIAQEPEANPVSQVTAGNLAYVIYTSGSTGKPKGVLVTHANIARLFSATAPWFHFDERDVWTLFHSYAFDFSVWEIWGALLFGGQLIVVPYLVSRSSKMLFDLLARERVTVLNQTPSAFRQLIQAEEEAEAALPLNLRLVIFGGEALELQSLRPWIARHGDEHPRLINMYGITETTVHVTYQPLSAAAVMSSTGSLIGVPIPDLTVHVLDQYGMLVPIGVPGELYVGGAGVARGYLNRPDVTTQRFVPDPFSSAPGARLYRTGDLARRLADGSLEFLGRTDHQVKIRGFRIELGEIETVLEQHPAVRQCVVLAREDTPGDSSTAPGTGRRLVAYIVPKQMPGPTVSELRSFLKEKLPEYMVPSAFVFLDALPLTPNGKVDRAALPAPEPLRPELERAFVAPRTPVEEVLADIWAEVLGREPVGIHDNFFELGGHSLLATQVMSRIHDVFQVELPLRILFETSTVAGLAAALLDPAGQPKRIERTAQLVLQLADMSDEEVGALLARKNPVSRRGRQR